MRKDSLQKLFPEIDTTTKTAFLFSFIAMLITHLYMFTNKIVNHDDVNRLLVGDTDEVKIQHGRWAGVFFDHVSGSSVSVPYIIGGISVLAVAGSCVLLVDIFKVKSRISIILICLLIATFPVSANIFLYGYIADVYFISMFLAVCGGRLLLCGYVPFKLAGTVLLTLACGCYQAFWCMGIGILFLYFVFDFLKFVGGGKENIKVWIYQIFQCFFWIGVSLILYLIITKLVQNHTGFGATQYQGLDSMGSYESFWQIIKVLIVSYDEFFVFFYKKGFFVASRMLVIINILLTVFMVAVMIKIGKTNKRSWGFWGIMLGIMICIPLFSNLISVASQNETHVLMEYGYVLPYFICIVLLEHLVSQRKDSRTNVFHAALYISIYIMLFMVVYKGYITDNEIYFRQQLNYEATYSYTLRLLYRIEEFDGYEPYMQVALINENPQVNDHITIMQDNYPYEMKYFDYLNDMVGTEPYTFVKRANDVSDFCKYYHGYDLHLVEIGELQKLAQSETFQQMGTYPDAGGMRLIDDVLVIKLPDGM